MQKSVPTFVWLPRMVCQSFGLRLTDSLIDIDRQQYRPKWQAVVYITHQTFFYITCTPTIFHICLAIGPSLSLIFIYLRAPRFVPWE